MLCLFNGLDATRFLGGHIHVFLSSSDNVLAKSRDLVGIVLAQSSKAPTYKL